MGKSLKSCKLPSYREEERIWSKLFRFKDAIDGRDQGVIKKVMMYDENSWEMRQRDNILISNLAIL